MEEEDGACCSTRMPPLAARCAPARGSRRGACVSTPLHLNPWCCPHSWNRLETRLREHLAAADAAGTGWTALDAHRRAFEEFVAATTTYRPLLLRIKAAYDATLRDAAASALDGAHLRGELATAPARLVRPRREPWRRACQPRRARAPGLSTADSAVAHVARGRKTDRPRRCRRRVKPPSGTPRQCTQSWRQRWHWQRARPHRSVVVVEHSCVLCRWGFRLRRTWGGQPSVLLMHVKRAAAALLYTRRKLAAQYCTPNTRGPPGRGGRGRGRGGAGRRTARHRHNEARGGGCRGSQCGQPRGAADAQQLGRADESAARRRWQRRCRSAAGGLTLSPNLQTRRRLQESCNRLSWLGQPI